MRFNPPKTLSRASTRVFAAGALLLVLSFNVTFGQLERDRGASRPGEALRQPDDILREALLLSSTNKWERARLLLSEAMQLWLRASDPGRAAMAAIQMGDRYKHSRRYHDSLYYYDRALQVKPLPGAMKAKALNSIARAYAELYYRDLALKLYNQALAVAQKSGSVSDQADALMGLADLYYRRGEKDRASDYILRARKVNQKQGEEAEANMFHLAAQIHQENGRLKQAREAFEQAGAIYRRTGSVEGQVRVLCSISNLHLISNQLREASELAERAVELAEEEGRSPDNATKLNAREPRWRARLSQARAERAAGNKEAARKAYYRSVQNIEALWTLVYTSTENSSLVFRNEHQAPYREYVDLLVEMGKVYEACEWAESCRARTVLSLTEARRLKGPTKKADREGKIEELTRAITRMRTELLPPEISDAQRAKLEKEISEAQVALKEVQLKAELEKAGGTWIVFRPASIDQMKKRLTRDKAAMLEFFLGEARSFVWLITPDGVWVEVLPGRKELEKDVGLFLKELTTAPNNMYMDRAISRFQGRASKLFSSMFGRIFEQIAPGQKLIIVPDGALHYVPVGALVRKGRYLIEDHEISYLPAAGMLELWQDSGEGDGAGDKTEGDKMELLALGDPVFGPGSKASDKGETMRLLHGLRGSDLVSLPRTSDEVRFIAGLFPPDRSKVFLRKESTEEAIKKEQLRRYKRLHFATHGLIDESSPLRSSVVLTLDNDPEEDGFLEVSEIAELDLDCDLVVLSACRTGRGQLLSGEGIMGMARAFFYAGARSVVVSLWNVSDISTGKLMKNFYQQMTANTGNVSALRRAKLQMMRSEGEARHPFYWSSFIIIGKP